VSLRNREIVFYGVLVELILFAIYLVWAFFKGEFYLSKITLFDLTYGIIFAAILFFINVFLCEKYLVNTEIGRDFINKVVKPLADSLSIFSALIISISAGIGEEFFFRAFLQNQFGIIVASVLFGVLHFIGAMKENFILIVIYTIVGFVLGFIYSYYGSIWIPVFTHAIYDFAALLYLKYIYNNKI